MDKLNPTAISFWICSASIGYIAGNMRGLFIGLAISTCVSTLLSTFFDKK